MDADADAASGHTCDGRVIIVHMRYDDDSTRPLFLSFFISLSLSLSPSISLVYLLIYRFSRFLFQKFEKWHGVRVSKLDMCSREKKELCRR